MMDTKETRENIQLLAVLAATIAYQAGVDPPGGVWASSGEGHNVGDPILLATHPGRFKAFFYFNSAAFVASLVIMVMLQFKHLNRGHALVVAMILDFFGLIGAYAAGSSRDTSTSVYTVALAGAVLIYVVIHIVFFTLDSSTIDGDHKYENHRQVLLLLAILAATLTYQAGLTPPGGFWEEDDAKAGHRAGFPVLQDKYPHRYTAFFYCNAASFMASVALIVLLLNKNIYKPGIQCRALTICMAAGIFGLMGAYAAGSSLHLRTSIIVLVLIGLVSAILLGLALHHICVKNKMSAPRDKVEEEARKKELEEARKEGQEKMMYLMLVGILAASVTYLTGLKPPGGMWRDDRDGHSAGNPVLYDINRLRYNIFFYSNSISFIASIIIIALLVLRMLQHAKNYKSAPHKPFKMLLWAINTAMVLDVLFLLVAYAAGSVRESRRSWKVVMIFPIVVVVVFIFYFFSKDQNIDRRPVANNNQVPDPA